MSNHSHRLWRLTVNEMTTLGEIVDGLTLILIREPDAHFAVKCGEVVCGGWASFDGMSTYDHERMEQMGWRFDGDCGRWRRFV